MKGHHQLVASKLLSTEPFSWRRTCFCLKDLKHVEKQFVKFLNHFSSFFYCTKTVYIMQHSPHYRINIKTIPLQITTLTEEALALTCRSTCSFRIASDLLCFPCFLICNFFISFRCQVVEKFLSIMGLSRCLGYWNNKVHKEL